MLCSMCKPIYYTFFSPVYGPSRDQDNRILGQSLTLELMIWWVKVVATNITCQTSRSCTYDHRTLKTRLPVRSALFKQRTGGLVVKWVTISESPLLYVFAYFCFLWECCGVMKLGCR
jgi:hypothetical protein